MFFVFCFYQIPSVSVSWAGITVVERTLALMDKALEVDDKWKYFVNIGHVSEGNSWCSERAEWKWGEMEADRFPLIPSENCYLSFPPMRPRFPKRRWLFGLSPDVTVMCTYSIAAHFHVSFWCPKSWPDTVINVHWLSCLFPTVCT